IVGTDIIPNSVPGINANISITYTADAEYYYDATDNTVRISEETEVPNGSLLAITSFSSHDVYRIKTKVFVGTDQLESNVQVGQGFDILGFDTSSYEGSSSVVVLDTAYPIDNDQTNASKILVSVNGRKMAPKYDYTIVEGVDDETGLKTSKVKLADSILINDTTVIVVTWTSAKEYKVASTFQIFKDMNDSLSYNRLSINESTVLAQNLNLSDTEIFVEDGSKLPDPNTELGIPGVVFVNAERIVYYTKSGNTLGQIRRGTSGTGALSTHKAGDLVIDVSERTVIPGGGNVVWYDKGDSNPSNGAGLQSASTDQAKFITEKKGIVVSRSSIDPDINTYIEDGYVEVGYVE
ncbi:MAG: hypothetical protein HOM20_12435, partial [Porticoccaceae bacterium]|nr:hypothetical protein [Porticoccaceae bacterium]